MSPVLGQSGETVTRVYDDAGEEQHVKALIPVSFKYTTDHQRFWDEWVQKDFEREVVEVARQLMYMYPEGTEVELLASVRWADGADSPVVEVTDAAEWSTSTNFEERPVEALITQLKERITERALAGKNTSSGSASFDITTEFTARAPRDLAKEVSNEIRSTPLESAMRIEWLTHRLLHRMLHTAASKDLEVDLSDYKGAMISLESIFETVPTEHDAVRDAELGFLGDSELFIEQLAKGFGGTERIRVFHPITDGRTQLLQTVSTIAGEIQVWGYNINDSRWAVPNEDSVDLGYKAGDPPRKHKILLVTANPQEAVDEAAHDSVVVPVDHMVLPEEVKRHEREDKHRERRASRGSIRMDPTFATLKVVNGSGPGNKFAVVRNFSDLKLNFEAPVVE